MGLPPKNLYSKHFEKCQFFRFGLHPYKLATLHATIGLIITLCYRIKLIKIKEFVTSQKTFVACNKFPHVKVARSTKNVGQACARLFLNFNPMVASMAFWSFCRG